MLELFERLHGTLLAQERKPEVRDSEADFLVLEVGVEPTCPVKGAGF